MLVVLAGGAVALEAGVFFEVADFIVPMTVRLAGGGGLVALARDAVLFLTTVAVLASLDSLVPLTFRLPRVEAVVAAAGNGGFLARVDVLAAAPVVVGTAAFLDAAAARDPFAFSTMLDRMLDDGLDAMLFVGEGGRPTMDLTGEVRRSAARGATRALVDVGDRTWLEDASTATTPARDFFLGIPIGSAEFSLS